MTNDPLLWMVQLRAKNRGIGVQVVSANELTVTGTDWTVYLDNLRRQAEHRPRDQWREMIDEFLDNLLVDDAGPSSADSLEEVRDSLRVRLYPADQELPDDLLPVRRPIGPGLEERLVLDLPTQVMTPSADTITHWRLSHDELLDLGRNNLRNGPPLEVQTDVVDDARIATLSGDGDYASGHLSWLDQYPVVGPYGALVSVPEEGVLFAHPITDHTVYPAGGVLADATVRIHDKAGKPIGRHLYHWRDGRIDLAAGLDTSDGELSIIVTEEFQALMEHLAGG